uniref:Uncharacterized protein n=1 Tax=Setaria digitata TaxID=48799 RepID=A0A915Q2P4_9BILA
MSATRTNRFCTLKPTKYEISMNAANNITRMDTTVINRQGRERTPGSRSINISDLGIHSSVLSSELLLFVY